MINIRIAMSDDAVIIALLGRITYVESHGEFIDNKTDLLNYNNEAFSVTKIKNDLKNPNNIFHIVYDDELPIGYAKLVLDATNNHIVSKNVCRLERIYILNDFIPKKIGPQLMNLIFKKATELKYDNMWLTVYIKNNRAISFYQKNEFKNVGSYNFQVGEKVYENIVFSKKL